MKRRRLYLTRISIVDMVEDPEEILAQMRPFLQWNVGADRLFKELQHCLAPGIQKTIKEQIKSEGNQVAVETILNHLISEDDWPSQLYRALLSPNINRPELAKKLKGSRMEKVLDSTKESDQSPSSMDDSDSVQLGAEKKLESCSEKTKVKNLPMNFLNSLKKNLDIEDGWKLLAVQLGYSSDDVADIDFKNGSPTEHLILRWIQEHPDADVETIIYSLHKMEFKSLSKELEEICENTFNSMDEASLVLIKDESPISIPDFNQVPGLSSIDESLKKGEHVSPTISPIMPRKTIITEMDMPEYSETYDQDCNTSISMRLKSASEKTVQSLDLFDFDSNNDTTIPLIESSSLLEPPISTESLNDSTSGHPSETYLCLEYGSTITNPQMADSGFIEYVDVKNQDLIENSDDLSSLGKNSLLLGSSSNENVSENTSKSLQDSKVQITEKVLSKMSESTNTASNTNSGSMSTIPTLEISLSESDTEPDTTNIKSKYDPSEIIATPVKSYEQGDPSFGQTQISVPEHNSAHFPFEKNDKIEIEPEKESKSADIETELEPQAAKIFVENIIKSAFIEHLASKDPSISFEPEVISAEVSAENTVIDKTEADSLVRSQESAFDNEVVVLSNPEEIQNDLETALQVSKPLTTVQTFSESDATITQREDPVTLSEDDNITELPEEYQEIIEATEIVSKDDAQLEIEAEITESIRKQAILEDKNVSQSENNSEMEVFEGALLNRKEQITNEISSKMSGNSVTASETNSESMSIIPALESTESDTEPDTAELKTKVALPDETVDSFASASLSSSLKESNSDPVISDVIRMKETVNSDVVLDTLTSEKFPIPETEMLDTEQVSVQDSSPESSLEIQPDMAVLNITELAKFMLISDTFTSKTVSEDTVSISTMELEDSIMSTELGTSINMPNIAMTNTVPKVKALTTLPEMDEDTVYELQATMTTSEIDSDVKLEISKDSADAIEILETPVKEDNCVEEEEKDIDMGLSPKAVEVFLPSKDSDNTPLDTITLHQSISNADQNFSEAKLAEELAKENKEIDIQLSPEAVEISLSSKVSDTIPLDGISLQQSLSNVGQISSEVTAEKSLAKPTSTYHYGYIVLGMAMVGSGMLLLRKYWK